MRRLHCESAAWHVIARGARRLELFRDAEDFKQALQCLAYALRKAGCELWAYTLMSNHYHLVLNGGSKALGTCMHHFNRIYSRYHNQKYALGGHVFDGPYRAFRQRTPRLTLWTLAYVFLNPVKAGICPNVEDYRWSGYRSFVGLRGSPMPVVSKTLMGDLEMTPRRAWERFHECMRLEEKRASKPVSGSPTMVEVHLSQFEWLLETARENLALLDGEDPVEVAIYWARQCGIAPRVMARALGMKDSTDIRQSLSRFNKRIANEPSLARLRSIP